MKLKIDIKGDISNETLSYIESIESKNIYVKENKIAKDFIRNLRIVFDALINTIDKQTLYFNSIFKLVSNTHNWVSENKWGKYFVSNTIFDFIEIGFQMLGEELVVNVCRNNLDQANAGDELTYKLPSECNPIKCSIKTENNNIIFGIKEFDKNNVEVELSPSNKIAVQLALNLYDLFFIKHVYSINLNEELLWN